MILSAYAALQDWDGIFGYTYADSSRNWSEDLQDGYFDLDRHPGKFMNLLIAANIFRRGDVRAANTLIGVSMGKEKELDLLPSAGSWRLIDGTDVGISNKWPLAHPLVFRSLSPPKESNCRRRPFPRPCLLEPPLSCSRWIPTPAS